MTDLESSLDNLIEQLTAKEEPPIYFVFPSARILRTWVNTTANADQPPATRVLVSEPVLTTVQDDFLTASRLAESIDDGALSLRVSAPDGNRLVVSDSRVWAILTAGDVVTTVSGDADAITDPVFEFYTETWETADSPSLRAPALSRVQETIEATFGPQVQSDFIEMLTTSAARADGIGLDVVEISLLVAAKHRELLYDISKWGEDTGVASKATFSRTKTRLEDAGILETEKVPLDVGRPRQRLLLGNERIREAPIPELISAVAEQLQMADAS